MKKRGQVSIFIVIGIVMLVILVLLFFFRDKISQALRQEPADTETYLSQQLEDIKREVGRCVNTEIAEASKLLIENGGNFEKDFGYIFYLGRKYPILCREIENGEGCLSEPILISNLEEKLNNYLPQKITNCMNLEEFRNKDYDLVLGAMNLSSDIFDDYIIVNVNLPVKLKKGVYTTEAKEFFYKLDIPLGDLTNTANDLVQIKASNEEIDTILFGLSSMNKYNLVVSKPYPDEVYDLSLTTNDQYHFYFAIEGIGLHERTGTIS